jgi:hypothetical protein
VRKIAWLSLSAPRTSEPSFDEENQEITYGAVHVVTGLQCDLVLGTTAQVVAAGPNRLFVTEESEDRYAGWEELMTYDDAINLLGAEDDGND